MQTDSSASRTYLASRSASEWTTTVLMPISRQARWMRSAISPRLAIRTLSKSLSAALATAALVRATWFSSGRTVARTGRGRALRVRRSSGQTITNSGWPNSTGWPFSVMIDFTTPALSASISFMSFIASMMHSA